MRFFCFHLMPWAHLPEDFAQRYDSAWVTCPNSLFVGWRAGTERLVT
jgi:hypothetical protein